jgi:hypothetical protein
VTAVCRTAVFRSPERRVAIGRDPATVTVLVAPPPRVPPRSRLEPRPRPEGLVRRARTSSARSMRRPRAGGGFLASTPRAAKDRLARWREPPPSPARQGARRRDGATPLATWRCRIRAAKGSRAWRVGCLLDRLGDLRSASALARQGGAAPWIGPGLARRVTVSPRWPSGCSRWLPSVRSARLRFLPCSERGAFRRCS